MSQKITYENKVALNENPSIADINKVKDTDMNEIKEVVNGNADVLDTKTQIFQGNTPPEDPEDGALWVDTNDEGVIVEVDQEINSGSTNAVSNSAITNYVNGLNTYSTEETVIGTWANSNGRKQPLYRKVISTNLPSTASSWVNVGTLPKNIKITKLQGTLGGYFPIPTYINESYYVALQYNAGEGKLLAITNGYLGVTAEITVEYTKPTDVPTSEEV